MARTLVIAALLFFQASPTAQDGTASLPNPFATDPFWNFHVGSARYAEMVEKARTATNPVDAIEANFAIGAKLGAIRAARGLLIATPADFARGARLLVERSHDLNDDGTVLRTEFMAFVADAERRAASFTGEDGAEAASAMLTLNYIANREDEAAHQRRIQAFLEKFVGTRAAAAMRVSHVEGGSGPYHLADHLRQFRELAVEYDGADAGAMALYLLGFRLGNSFDHPANPTDRLVELFDVVKRIESGRFPQSRWVEQAPGLITEFYFGLKVEIPPASIPVLYARYLEFVLAHPVVRTRFVDGGVDLIIRHGVARLAPTPIERGAIVEDFLEQLERGGFGINNVRFLRASFYLSLTDPAWISDHLKGAVEIVEAEARAVRNLRNVIDSGDAAAAGRATALLGHHYFSTGRYSDARRQFMALLTQYPDVEWSWVAAMRVAQINERLGQKTAAADYEAVAMRHPLPPAAVVLSRVSAAELREQAGELPAAAIHYRQAVEAWQSLSDPIRLFMRIGNQDGELPLFRRFANLTKSDLVTRLDRLSKVVSTEAALLHEGRRALELDKPREAMAPLQRLVSAYPKSAPAIEGRLLLRRAQFADILTTPQKTAATAERGLTALASGPYDSVTTLSKLARVALKVRTSATGDAEALLKQALDEWGAKQSNAADAPSPLAQDIAAIRAELFRPQGGGVFGQGGWNAFKWPKEAPGFAIVSRDIQIKTADGKEQRVSAPFTANVNARMLFASYEDLASMRMILDKIGGTDVAEWVNSTDVPNQPIGDSVKIAQLWSRFFPLRPGHWGGWELTIYPYVTKITFDRDNHALAEFTAGYSGGTVELEKEKGVWVAKRIVSTWIT